MIPFTKMQALGNDYVVIDAEAHPVIDASALAKVICDRRTGVGADGLLLLEASGDGGASAPRRMRIVNADGTGAEHCGNGLRCAAAHAVAHGLGNDGRVSLAVGHDVFEAQVEVHDEARCTVHAPVARPVFGPEAVGANLDALGVIDGASASLDLGSQAITPILVATGNPHAVLLVDDVEALDLALLGRAVEHHAAFPKGINLHLVAVEARDRLFVRSWERGVGPTQACGTGAAAALAAVANAGCCSRTVTARMPGGDMELTWGDDDWLRMTGEAVTVFGGHWPRAT